MYSFYHTDVDLSDSDVPNVDGKPPETIPAQEESLQDDPTESFIGHKLRNAGENICYLNSFVQSLGALPLFRRHCQSIDRIAQTKFLDFLQGKINNMEWLRAMLYKAVFEHYLNTHTKRVVDTYASDYDKLEKDAKEILERAKLKGPPYRHPLIEKTCKHGLPNEPQEMMKFIMWKKIFDSTLFFRREQCDPTNVLNWLLTGRYVHSSNKYNLFLV